MSDRPKAVSEEIPDAARLALARYETVARAAQVSRIGQGLIHETFLVEERGLGEEEARRWVLQGLNPIFSPRVHENIAAVTERLAAAGVETPLLVPTTAGTLYTDLGPDGCWRLLSHVPGFCYDTCGSEEAARSAGELVGRFHSALDGLVHEFQPLGFPFHEPKRHFADLENALTTHTAHPLHAEVASVAAEIRAAVASWQSLDDLPARVVHLDLKFNNVLFDRTNGGAPIATCLIDLDTLSRRPLYIELGDAWRSWCNRKREHEPVAELDHRIFEASAGGWLDTLEIPLSREELASLAHGIERLTIELCSRFAADALEERYFGWNRDLFARAGDHNLSRARGQLSMHAQARETREERLRFLLG